MKQLKSFFIAAALICAAGSVSAQKVPVVKDLPKPDLGIKLGANFASLGGDNWVKTYQPGVLFGAFAGLHKGKWGLQAEALINTCHYTTAGLVDSVHKGDFRAIYFDIPVLIQYKLVGAKLAPKIWVMAGPQFSNLISVKSLGGLSSEAEKTFTSSTVSAVAGLEVRYLKFVLGARYMFGFTNINNSSTFSTSTVTNTWNFGKDTWNNRSYQLYLGFKFI